MKLPLQKKRRLYLINCLNGSRAVLDSFPSGINSNGEGKAKSPPGSLPLVFVKTKSGLRLHPRDEETFLLNSEILKPQTTVGWDSLHTLQGKNSLFIFCAGSEPDDWSDIDPSQWIGQSTSGNNPAGPFSWGDLAVKLQREAGNKLPFARIAPQGSSLSFPLEQVKPLLLRAVKPSNPGALPPPPGQRTPGSQATPSDEKKRDPRTDPNYIDTEAGELTSPFTWERFGAGDIMHISTSEDLKGDDYLGPDVPRRFRAIRFTDRGHAVDPLGSVCQEIACPHTHLPLPPGFLERPQHIFSLVGAPSSGKSYYLCVLTRRLSEILYQKFGYAFKDTDPSSNVNFNAMKNRLFSGGSSAEAALVKTRLDGDMYISIHKDNRNISLPRPFSFVLEAGNDQANFIFYDNAGEHFEPGRDSLESPGGRHVAASDATFFLFDPVASKSFREKLNDHADPQLQMRSHADQQDILIAETEARIRRLHRLPTYEKWPRPFALLVGKSDIWEPLLPDPLQDPWQSGKWNPAIVRSNSNLLRELMREMAPTLVANLESFASNVAYFAVSSFGHSPHKLENGALAPDPQRIRPRGVEAPFLWALETLYPGVLEGQGLIARTPTGVGAK